MDILHPGTLEARQSVWFSAWERERPKCSSESESCLRWWLTTAVLLNQLIGLIIYLCQQKPSVSPLKGVMNCFRWNGFHFQNKLPDPQSANEKAIACDNLILPSRLALLGPTPGKGSSAAYKLPVSVLTPATAASWETHLLCLLWWRGEKTAPGSPGTRQGNVSPRDRHVFVRNAVGLRNT